MEHRNEIRDFLTTRRARITPEEAGLPAFGANRRVPGLRREEVAMLAGVSVDYYIRFERGDAPGASEEVIDGVARALRLDGAERAHLHDLLRGGTSVFPAEDEIRPEIIHIVDAMDGMPAMLRNGRLDVLHANRLGRALYSEMYRADVRPVNVARFTFLDGRAEEFFVDWSAATEDMAALLRSRTARNPSDRTLFELVDDLTERSDRFRELWSAHDVLSHRTGVGHFRHPGAGELTLIYEDLDVAADPGLTILAFAAGPDPQSRAGLDRLAAWAGRQDAKP